MRGLTALKHAVLELVSGKEHVSPLTRGQFSLQYLAPENLGKLSHAQNGVVQVGVFVKASVMSV